MRVKFLQDRDVEAQGEVIESFKAGEVYELSASSARRWIRRELAMEVQGAAAPKRPATKPATKKAGAKKKKTFKRKHPVTSTKKSS